VKGGKKRKKHSGRGELGQWLRSLAPKKNLRVAKGGEKGLFGGRVAGPREEKEVYSARGKRAVREGIRLWAGRLREVGGGWAQQRRQRRGGSIRYRYLTGRREEAERTSKRSLGEEDLLKGNKGGGGPGKRNIRSGTLSPETQRRAR